MKAHDRLRVYRTVDVPLTEVSGICLRRGPAGELVDGAGVASAACRPSA